MSFDGHSPARLDEDGKRHAYVDIASERLRFTIGCNYSGMPGRIRGGVLHLAGTDDGSQTSMGCGSEREARDAAFFRFFRARPQVGLLPGGRLHMSGSGRELILERAAVRRLANGPSLSEIAGLWRVVGFTQFDNGGSRGWGAMHAPGRVSIIEGRLSYSRCPQAAVRFTYTPDFVLRRQGGGKPRVTTFCRGAVPASTEVEPLLAALLGQSPEVERVHGERVVLRSRAYAVLLARESDYQRQFGEQTAEWERRPG